MAQRDGTPIDIELRDIESELTNHGQGLHRECLVQLDQIHILQLQPRLPQYFRNRLHWSDTHDFRTHASRGISDESRERLAPHGLGPRFRHDDNRSSAVTHLTAVAYGHGP